MREMTEFPVDEGHFALYLQHLAEKTASKAALESAVNAIAWAHSLAGVKINCLLTFCAHSQRWISQTACEAS